MATHLPTRSSLTSLRSFATHVPSLTLSLLPGLAFALGLLTLLIRGELPSRAQALAHKFGLSQESSNQSPFRTFVPSGAPRAMTVRLPSRLELVENEYGSLADPPPAPQERE